MAEAKASQLSPAEQRVRAWFAQRPDVLQGLWEDVAAVQYAAEMKFTRGPPMSEEQMKQYGYTFPNQQSAYQKFWGSHYLLERIYLDVLWLKGRGNAERSQLLKMIIDEGAPDGGVAGWLQTAKKTIVDASLELHKLNYSEAATRGKWVLDLIMNADAPAVAPPPAYEPPASGSGASPRAPGGPAGVDIKDVQPAVLSMQQPPAEPSIELLPGGGRIVSDKDMTRYYDAEGRLHRDNSPLGVPQPAVIYPPVPPGIQGVKLPDEYWTHGVQQFYPFLI